ncbi:MAG: AAA family ATPase, partial [Euryarchaeota archaeon]|nr:AAA family ATPase [Euryarchaeota archaeon]
MSAEGGAFRTPPEIITFFTKPGGHSLILRGNAGTGKTTFALQTIEDLSAIEKSYYLSTRVSDASLFTQFPWLREKVNRGETTPRALAAEDATKNGGPSPPTRAGLASLKGIGGTAGGPTRISVSIGRDLSELEAIYKTLETKRETKSLIVIDSIDALAQKYGESCANLILAIQSDVVEGYGANVLFVLESSDPQLD